MATFELKVAEKKDALAIKRDIEGAKIEIICWMFAGSAVLMLAIIGLYFKH